MLPYFLGCPSWSEPAWRGTVSPSDSRPGDSLLHYARLFNAVEGNTTFYARPSVASVERWAQQMPEGFRFCAKLPRDISHSHDLTAQLGATEAFLQLLAPLGARVSPLWLQLPASFGPERLSELLLWLDAFNARQVAVELRHPAFFDRGEAERQLNRALQERAVERICLDSRALFASVSTETAVLHAQAKKPRLPIRPTAFSHSPQLRFIGGPELEANAAYLAPWLDKVADWIEQGLTPYVFLHTPDNHLAAQQAIEFHRELRVRIPSLPELNVLEPAALQLGLL